MSSLTCTFIPKKGKNLMNKLRNQYGYNIAKEAMLKGALNPRFLKDFGHSLVFDTEGVPSFESFIALPYVQEVFIGKGTILKSLNKNPKVLEDTIDNYKAMLQEAFTFNTQGEYRDSYIAQVNYTEDGKLKLFYTYKTEDNFKAFTREYRQLQLNEKLSSLFSPLGVTIGELNKVEVAAGRVGSTDFSVVDQLAKDFISVIKVANNKEGAQAISEEFSHLIIGCMRDNPLIKRSLNYLENSIDILKAILGKDYEDVVKAYNNDMALVAEEALGHILQDNLINLTTDTPLFNRTVTNVRSQFKGYKETDVEEAVSEVNQMMSEIAKSVIDNSLPITRERILNSRRQVKLNALSDRVKRNIEVLNAAKQTEIKRYRISKEGRIKDFAQDNVTLIDTAGDTEISTTLTLSKYAQKALEEMKQCSNILATVNSMPINEMFASLRYVKNFIASYGNFIDQVNTSIHLNEEEKTEEDAEIPEIKVLKDTINEMAALSRELTTIYTQKAHRAFCDFLKPYLGDTVILKMKGAKGTQLTVEELLNSSDKDISFFDRWMDSMGDSSDVLLQTFDQIVKQTKDAARIKTMDTIRQITALRQEAEEAGISSFEWMFEKDATGRMSGDYIRKINYAEFYRQYSEFIKALNEKYGKNPSGEDAIAKLSEREQWLKENAMSTFGRPVPNNLKWVNKDYENLSEKQKEILEKFIKIKESLELRFPTDKADTFRAIQIRKDTSQRIIDAGMSPTAIFNTLKNYYSKSFLDKIDDDQTFGQSSRGAMTDFEGHEYMVLPILYTARLENPNELSTDVFATLMQYAYMANNYEAMDDVVDALETGRSLVKENRQINKTRGNLPVIEKVKTSVGKYAQNLITEDSNIERKLDDFFESQVYGRYLKDSGAFTVFGKSVNKNKIVSFILNRSSFVQLGFNWLANIGNILTGTCMQNIEAVAGEYFNLKELASADAEYFKLLGEFTMELGSRSKESKLALFDELIDFKGDFRSRIASVQKKNWLQRIFGENIAFMGQDGGDHWLYNRTAIAMAKRTKVIVPGKGEMSLWDALEIVDNIGYKKMILPKGTTSINGKEFSITKWARQVLHVNQSLFGIYNEDDSNAANRVIMGRLLQQYRKWIKPQYNKRFQAAQQSLTMDGKIEEGYYRTLLRICEEIAKGQITITDAWSEMNDSEKANVKRALTEIAQFLGVWALVNLIEWPDDKDRPWAIKLAEYASRRLYHELGGLTPSLAMAQEMLKNVKNPVPSSQIGIDMINLISSTIDPRDWTDEIQSGPYKGLSTLEKNILKSPLRGVAQYKQIKKFSKDIDTSIQYYARSY